MNGLIQLFSILTFIISFTASVQNTHVTVTVSEIENQLQRIERLIKEQRSCDSRTPSRPANCAELLVHGNTKSGTYTIYPRTWFKKAPFDVYCDMETAGGGWTVFQRRDDYEKQENFSRSWDDYRKGFGDLEKEFWLGNDHLYLLTNQEYVTLRIDLEDFENNTRYAIYKTFRIDNAKNKFKLSVGDYSGDAGDSMPPAAIVNKAEVLNNGEFVTIDKDNVRNCAKLYKGGWWYNSYESCHWSNLNGLNLKREHASFADGINWKTWREYHYSLKMSEMKIRPTHFSFCED